MYDNIKVIAFDADDTMWVNEPYFQELGNEILRTAGRLPAASCRIKGIV